MQVISRLLESARNMRAAGLVKIACRRGFDARASRRAGEQAAAAPLLQRRSGKKILLLIDNGSRRKSATCIHFVDNAFFNLQQLGAIDAPDSIHCTKSGGVYCRWRIA